MAAALVPSAASRPMAFGPLRRPVEPLFALRVATSLVSEKGRTLSPLLLNRRLKQAVSPSVRCPAIKAQSSPGYVPDANFYKIEAILRPWRLSHVSSALLQMGIRGVTVSDVRGFGAQGGSTERHGGSEFEEDKFISKIKMEIVVSKDQVEAVIEKIIEEARTGEIGDGKIFLIPVSDVIRVRTGERGEKAERMSGGRADMISASSN